MAYIGTEPIVGQYRVIDNISSNFNGAATTFNLQVTGTPVTAGSAQQLLVSLGGVIQAPGVDYTVSTNTITFTTAPTVGLSFFAVLMGDTLNVGTPSDGTVTTAKLDPAGIAPLATSVKLLGATSGYTEIKAPTVAGNNTLSFPTGNGTNGQFLQTNGSGALSWASASNSLTLGTSQSASGTAVTFTGIPSTTKRIIVMLNGVSTTGTSQYLIQIGSGSLTTSGYSSTGAATQGATLGTNISTAGFLLGNTDGGATWVKRGTATIVTAGSNLWLSSSMLSVSNAPNDRTEFGAGSVTLSGTLDRVSVTTVGGTDTFDLGTINILYEG